VRRMTLADEHRAAIWEVPGLDVDIRQLHRALARIGRTGKPAAFGECGISIRLYSTSQVCCGSVIVSQAPWDNGVEWIHASVSHETRMPTYGDLDALKAGVYGPHRYAFQVFAPADRHVNIHARALHLWGRADGKSPLPDFGVMGTI
jgi:hypothetical protein